MNLSLNNSKRLVKKSIKLIQSENEIKFGLKLDDLIVLIPSNRLDYLSESINYFSKFPEVKVLYYLNTSFTDTDLFSDNFDNVKFIISNENNIFDHWLNAVKSVQEKYIFLCPDDDFVHIPTLIQGYKYMQDNPNTVVFHGKNISFEKNTFINGQSIKEIDISYQNRYSIVKPYQLILFSLFSKDFIIEAFELSKQIRFSNYNFFELLIAQLSTFRGFVKITNKPWVFRRIIKSSLGSKHRYIGFDFKEKSKDIIDYISIMDFNTDLGESEKFIREYIEFYEKNLVKQKIFKYLYPINYFKYVFRKIK